MLFVCGIACTEWYEGSVSDYYDNRLIIITSAVNSVPIPVIASTFYIEPTPSYYNSGYATSYVDTGFAFTSFRSSDNNCLSNNDDFAHTYTGFSSTSFR